MAWALQAVRWLVRLVFRLRYRVEARGLDRIRGLDGPVLVMPNHPAYIDPPLLLSHLQLGRTIRPVVISGMYRKPLLYPVMRLVKALEVPDLREHSRGAQEQTLAMIDALVAGLEKGEAFLIYPAGHVKSQGAEVIGAARAAAEVLQRCPHATVVLVRTQGLWGSMFSYAPTGNRPNLGRCLLRGLGWIAANFVLFTPRRRVTMTVEVLDRRQLPEATREKLNRHLEAWYNVDGPETPVYVPYHRLFGHREFKFPDPAAFSQVNIDKIRPATIQAVNEIVEEHLGRPFMEEEKQSQATLDQIGLDSLDRMDVALAIEDRFGFRSNRVAETLGELWTLAEGLVAASSEDVATVPALWGGPPSTQGPLEILAETLAEAVVRRALAHPGDVVVADRLSGVLTYRRFAVGAQLLANRFRGLPGNAIGLMLPASVAADLSFFGLHLAGKLPVMLNWTTGPANLAHAVGKLDVTRVVTSRKLVDRLGIEVPGVEYVFLEELRREIGRFEAIGGMLAFGLFPGSFLKRLPKQRAEDTAVVLFTSGSESTPKAVPLTHRNLIGNTRACVAALQPTRADRMLGFLPPFHSFGLTGTILAPILTGMRVIHSPDPTNAAALVQAIDQYQTTFLVTTPTFLSYMLGVATEDNLRFLRVIVTGAEKCPESLFARSAELAPAATILECYGITECSPGVAANRMTRRKPGTVGLPVDGVEILLVDPETRKPVPPGTTGMLLVRGPSVFAGYLEYDGPDPFAEVDGQRWYVTGDLVRLDEEGFIHFQGRLKRFLKAGGEMISLPALEEPLAQAFPPTEDGPRVAVEGIETPGGRQIVLFTTQEIALRDANARLAEAGFRGVMRLDEVVRLDRIPVLGTGKTDYKVLRNQVKERMVQKAAG